MTELAKLNKKRGTIKAGLTVFSNYLKDVSSKEELSQLELIKLKDRLNNVEKSLSDFNQCQTEIEMEDSINSEEQFVERERFENSYYDAIALAKYILKQYEGNSQVINSNFQSDGIKLPDISLPKFSGKFEDWLEFRDIYKSLIHENKRLNNIQKFHYLRGALEGTAAASISKIKYSENNYEVAWATITNRFNNNKKLIYEHIKAIFSVEPISKPNSQKLQNLADDICKHLGSIEQLGQNVDNWDPLLIFWLSNKLDSVSSLEWDRETKDKEDLPTIDQFLAFLQRRANFVDTQEAKVNLNTNSQDSKGYRVSNDFKHKRSGNIKSLVSLNHVTCSYCKREHAIYNCEEFLNLTLLQKRDFVRKANLCYNCLRSGHSTKRCRLGPCKECKSWHNSILHDSQKSNTVEQSSIESTSSATTLNSSVVAPAAAQILLSTAHILITDKFNELHKIRALLDCGSQTSFITESLVKRLKLDTQNADLSIFGISNNISKINKRCKVLIKATNAKFEINCNCYILRVITGAMPSFTINTCNWKIPNHLSLADPKFFEPSQIDMLLGADIFWTVLGTEKINLGRNMPILYNSSFGWLISGALGAAEQKRASCHLSLNQELLNAISKFWEIEDFPDIKTLSPDEQLCEDNFIQTTIRDDKGRFTVTIPLTQNPSNLGDSRTQAEKRFYALERKFKRNASLHERYKNFMHEYRSLGHMTISDERDGSHFEYFMPHHGVTKEESLTTKLRVVFDASAPSSNGLSFNNIQRVGPILQDDLLSIILRFRKHNYVISADIAKMYRQVLVAPQQRVLQKIFWRDNPTDKLDIYQLNTVTYGQTSSSYLAIRCILQLANEIHESQSEIAEIIKHDFYVDDLLTGAGTIAEAQSICEELSKMLNSGRFELRKWCSNHADVLKTIRSGNLDHNVLDLSGDNNMKTLGLTWSCQNDVLLYNISHERSKSKTKRTILSAIAKIFDPLGLLSPCTILAKILMQTLWMEKVPWDQTISGSILETWNKFESELFILNQIQTNRQALCKNYTQVHLHGFADASQRAYGASIYLRSIDNHKIHIALLCAKSKVAPLKTITIPRLELCAATLLARLYHKVKISLKMELNSCTLWSDSTITLAWIRTSPNLLKTFTGNRVSEIQRLTEGTEWRYVPTHDNPADIVSRGLYPSEIIKSNLWWNGPSWLSTDEEFWPGNEPAIEVLPDLKPNTLLTISKETLSFPFERFSKFVKMQRTTAYILRFCRNCLEKDSKRYGPLTVNELDTALNYLIRVCQNDSFPVEIHRLKYKKPIGPNTSIIMLSPFLDSSNILRVGGRLKFSDYPFDKKHPILIHSKHHFTKLLFVHEHHRTFHGGPQLLLSTIRETYWPVSGRNLARSTVKKCLICFKFRAKSIQPLMANLPHDRVSPSSAFSVVGIDYAGSFIIKDRKGRGSRHTKCYIGLFICLSTKAVHLELISSLSTEAFLQALHRFISRRGKPCKILSDNGKNFVGAQRELTKFLNQNVIEITNQASSEGIKWNFIPPYSPHFGGLWESAVKSVKHHLKRIMFNASLLFEEFATILCQIEAILNSRPLCPLSFDSNDLGPLTPAHLLIGRPLIAAPDQNVTDVNISYLSRFQLLQLKVQQFWNRWKLDYICELQKRNKWQTSQGQLTEGSLVLIKGEHTPPTQWLLGRICELHKGPDGIARVASIRTSTGTVKRGFQKICPLPLAV